MTKKLITTLEKERGLLFLGKIDEKKKLTDDEFDELLSENTNNFVGVDHEGRTKFLEDNGYEITRENMVDSTLGVRPGTT